ncbi:hypothetical protein BC829DRAFT_391765 [Chytridium lagenaria]|nr:hypothetical protein BC829DRAFT_391765 [Chytridium lagenaria]
MSSSIMSINEMSFDQCWLIAVSGGLQWSTLVGFCTRCLWIPRNLIETGYIAAKRECVSSTAFSPSTDAVATIVSSPLLAYLLLFNELNWIVHEATTVYYSFIKTSVIFTSETLRRTFTIIMAVLMVAFAALRFNIGRLRFSNNALGNAAIANAHSYAFLVWGVADLIILFLLVWNVYDHNPSLSLSNFNSFLWLVKGSYPMILLLDILMTKTMLISSRDKSSSHKRTGNRADGIWGNNATSSPRKKPTDEEDTTDGSSGAESYQLQYPAQESRVHPVAGGSAHTQAPAASYQSSGYHSNSSTSYSGASTRGGPATPAVVLTSEKRYPPQLQQHQSAWPKEKEALGVSTEFSHSLYMLPPIVFVTI